MEALVLVDGAGLNPVLDVLLLLVLLAVCIDDDGAVCIDDDGAGLVNDAALRLAEVHTIAHCRWDGKEDTRPKLHRAAAVFLTVDFVSARPGVRIVPKPDFATVMRIARSRAYPAPQ